MAPPLVGVVLSTGRCGTQWLTMGLREFHPHLSVEHEPIGSLYAPRLYFRRYQDPDAVLEVDAVREHLHRIQSLHAAYIETGWPLFSALPLLAKCFGDRLRVVHLTRHPVPTALSHLAHSSYAGSPRDDPYTRLATLGPEDGNVFQPGYADRWHQLSPYEKCLFWWTEVNLLGLELPQRLPGTQLLRIKAESLLAGDEQALRALLSFLELSWDPRWLGHVGRNVDRWRHHTDRQVDPLQVHRHARTVEVADALGYDLDALNVTELLARYRGAPDPGLDRYAQR